MRLHLRDAGGRNGPTGEGKWARMAHLPRWLDDATVDSSAMAIAYSAWYKRQEPQPSPLPMFIHQAGPERYYMLACWRRPVRPRLRWRAPAAPEGGQA